MDTALMDALPTFNEPVTRRRTNPRSSEEVQLDRALAVFQDERPRLFRIAQRILGSVPETEDVMQDVWLRWQRTDRRDVGNSSAFLATVTSRAAINVVQSARCRHESTTASSLKDLAGDSADPTVGMDRAETVELVIRVLLARTSPAERAAYLLRRAFDYPYWKIAQILQLGVANSRQLVRRAHVGIHTGTMAVVGRTHPHLVRAFLAAAQDGEFAELEAVLVADVRGTSRRGGRITGGARLARRRSLDELAGTGDLVHEPGDLRRDRRRGLANDSGTR